MVCYFWRVNGMNIKTKTGIGVCEVFFGYYDWAGKNICGNYSQIREENENGGGAFLVGFLRNNLYNCIEVIDELEISGKKPSISQIKRFIKGCYKVIE